MTGVEICNGGAILFGGPYSNLAATRAMRAEAERLGFAPAQVICTGDLVAYCAQPRETAEFVRDWGIPVVMGNCEESLAEYQGSCGCGFEQGSACATMADDWFPFASQRIDGELRRWMGDLPRSLSFVLGGLEVLVVHACPSAINRFIFPSTPYRDKASELAIAGCDVLVGGHSGIPFGEKVGKGYWLNSGVIGMPANDGTPDGWYLLLRPADGGLRASWHRLCYDWRESAERMARAGLCEGYRKALETGRWPSMDILPARERAQCGLPIAPRRLAINGSSK